MPRLITTPRWGCDFKCGRVTRDKKWIEKHEQTCFKNPARRACKTCKHDIKEKGEGGNCYCAVDADRPYADGKITCRCDCPEWEPKN